MTTPTVDVNCALLERSNGTIDPFVVVVVSQPSFVLSLEQSAALRARLLLAEEGVQAKLAERLAANGAGFPTVGNA